MRKLLASVILVLAGAVITSAQNFEVAPISLKFTANPGETQTKLLTVKNHGNNKASIVLTFQDYLIYKNGERKILSPGSAKNSIAEWITLNPSYLEINPNQAQTVEVTLQAPNDDYSSKWGILNVSTAREQTAFQADKELSAGLNVFGRINVNLSYTPRGEANKRVQISNLKEVTRPKDTVRRFTANVDNLGNTITDCKVYLIASNLKTLYEKKFQTVNIKAFPQTSRNVELTLPSNLPEGMYSLSAILDYGSSKALEGTQITIEVD